MAWTIKDWDVHYENSRSRSVTSLSWVSIPNKHDGKGYNKVANSSKRCEIFSVMILAVQVASKMPKRGILADLDGDLTFEDMALKTRFPKKLFETWLPWLELETGWIFNSNKQSDSEPSGNHQADSSVVRKKGMGGDGMEGNGRGGEGTDAAAPKQFFESWNRLVAGSPLALAKALSKDRSEKCRTRLSERPLGEWETIFSRMAKTPFLNGKNKKGWRASFDWIIANESNALKVLEGKYDDRPVAESDRVAGAAGYEPGKYNSLLK